MISRNKKSSNWGDTKGYQSNTYFDDRELRAQNVIFQSISAVSSAKATLLKKNGINKSIDLSTPFDKSMKLFYHPTEKRQQFEPNLKRGKSAINRADLRKSNDRYKNKSLDLRALMKIESHENT